jgi:hypothetical protein
VIDRLLELIALASGLHDQLLLTNQSSPKLKCLIRVACCIAQ